jgi:protein-disulfide isomerase
VQMTISLRPKSWRMLAILTALSLSLFAVAACAQPILPAIPANTADSAGAGDAEATEAATAAPQEDAAEGAPEAGAEAEATAAAVEEVAADGSDTGSDTGSNPAAVEAAGTEPTVTGEWEGMPVGFTAEGYPFRGEPDAPITMIEFSDFECPFCARYFVQTEPALNESYVRTGQMRVVFRDFPLVELHPNAPAAHQASLCVAEQGAELYWPMHAKLFQTQTEWSNSIDPLPVFERLAEESGAAVDAYRTCMEAGDATQAQIDAGLAAGQAAGVTGTPSFFFIGADGAAYPLVGAQPYDQFALYIESMLRGEKPPVPEQEQAQAEGDQEIPFWATAEGWLPDPDRPGFNMAGDVYRGNLDAKVTVIEFSDFQCPFCKQHVEETQPALDEEFVDTGDVMWVFKHFPLGIHPQAPGAGVASECAAEQGKFWEMHHLLFENQERWGVEDPNPIFEELAADLELDAAAFAACLADPAIAERVTSDMSEGAPFVQGTPTFIVLANGQGQIIPGALPIDTFRQVLQEVVDGAQ